MSTEERAAIVFGECREQVDRGERVDPEEVIRAHPDLAQRLRKKFDALRRVEGVLAESAPRHGARPPALLGRTLGPYRLEAVLGSGGMGTVFLASNERAARDETGEPARVAVKVVHPHLVAEPGFFKRFLREAEIGRRVRHENVVRTLDADEVVLDGESIRFLVMEYVEGRTLRELREELDRVPEELCRHIGREVARALAAIHAVGAVHRDLKPENALITSDHVVKVMDLGVARLEANALAASRTGAFVGSVRYAAPEQFRGRRAVVDGRADLYALGLTLYELATGAHPFGGDDFHEVLHRQLNEVPRPAGERNPQLSAFFEEVLRVLLEKDAEKRIATAAALATILDEGERSAWWAQRAKAIRAGTHRPLRRIRIPRETALYGRDGEIARLRAAFEQARGGDGQVLLVEGEAGIGKTRLVDEVVGILRRDGVDFDFLFGSYPPGGAASASGAFSTAYREHFGDDEAALRAALPVTPLLVPAFAALLRGDGTPEGAEPLTKDSLQTVFVHATRSLAAVRTTIVLIDDLHFAPEEGRALFTSLALAVPGHRILLLGTARPGLPEAFVAALSRQGHFARMTLPRLGAKDLARLLVDAFRSERLAEELAYKLGTKSDGNPYFVFELLRGLRDGQFIRRQPDGTWVTTRVIADIEVPSTVKDLIFARVGSLGTEERNLLDVAACAGFEFDPALVGEVVGLSRIPSLQRLAGIEKSHRLVRSAGHRFAFDHHQVAEVLYAALPEPLREEYHVAFAGAIERAHGAASKEPGALDGAVCVDLARHFLKGAQGLRGLRYLDAALTHLETGYLNDAAVLLAGLALAAPRVLAGAERGRVLLRLADRLGLLGRAEPQRAAIEEALALARETGVRSDEARATQCLGSLFLSLGRTAEAREHMERSGALCREIGDRALEATALGNLGLVFRTVGRYVEAREHFERHLTLAREMGHRDGEAGSVSNLGVVLLLLGHFAEARMHLEGAITLCREIGHRRFEAISTGNLGVVFNEVGRFAEARENLERSLALAREIGFRQAEANATGILGSVFRELGRWAEAREHSRRHLDLTREIGDRRGEEGALGSVAAVLNYLGCTAEAREHFERQLALAREIGDRREEAAALGALAEVASVSMDVALAEGLLAESIDIQHSIGVRSEEAAGLLNRGVLRARVGRTAEARADLDSALAFARELSIPDLEVVACAHLATLPGGDASAGLAAISRHGDRVGVRMLMTARFLLWQATGDRAHVVEAKRLLDHLVVHAPPECRESMLANVRLHREIAEAARTAGF